MQVRVKEGQIGFYGLRRQRSGAVFNLDKPEHFSPLWMDKVDPKDPFWNPPAAKPAAKAAAAPVPPAEDQAADEAAAGDKADDTKPAKTPAKAGK